MKVKRKTKRYDKILSTLREDLLKKAMREMGSKGGKRAAEKMTAAERSERARKAVQAREAKRKATAKRKKG